MEKYSYDNLEVYKLAVRMVVETYNLTKKFPREEIFELMSHLRRATMSVLLNIVEGSSRNSKKDFASFIDRGIGSTVETRVGLQVAVELKFTVKKEIA